MQKAKAILKVGENPAIKQMFCSILPSGKLIIESAENSIEGLANIEACGYDLILTDTQTPGTFDMEVLKRIREIRPDTKVIVLASESSPEDIGNSIREHAFSYFCVPFEQQTLTDMICKALDIPVWEDSIEVLSVTPQWIALEVRCKMIAADRLVQFMREIKLDLLKQDRENIAIAFRELLLNAMDHGGEFDPHKKIYIEYMRTSRVLL
jgi:CheY-like chemotaxis protein